MINYIFCILFFLLSFDGISAQQAMLTQKDAHKILSNVPCELQEQILSAEKTKMHILHHTGKKHNYTFSLSVPSVIRYGYYPNHRDYLFTPTTLNTPELVVESKKGTKYEHAPAYADDVFFNIQCWAGGLNRSARTIRFDDSLRNETLRLQVFENLIHENAAICFDGPNQNRLIALGINSSNARYKKSRMYFFKMLPDHSYIAMRSIYQKDYQISSFMLHNYDSRVVYSLCNTLSKEHALMIADIIQTTCKKEHYDLKVRARVGLSCGLTHIGRLNDRMYLALAQNGRLQLINVDSNNLIVVQEKKVSYIKGSYPVIDLVRKARYKNISYENIEIQKGAQMYKEYAEDLFTHLAVDNCTDTSKENITKKRDAVAFAAINHEHDIFYCSLKSPFYNDKQQITLRKLNVGNTLAGGIVYNMWLAGDKITLQGKKDGKEYVQTVKVRYVMHEITKRVKHRAEHKAKNNV